MNVKTGFLIFMATFGFLSNEIYAIEVRDSITEEGIRGIFREYITDMKIIHEPEPERFRGAEGEKGEERGEEGDGELGRKGTVHADAGGEHPDKDSERGKKADGVRYPRCRGPVAHPLLVYQSAGITGRTKREPTSEKASLAAARTACEDRADEKNLEKCHGDAQRIP